GPAGATAATDLARAGRSVALLDQAGRIKPCGGAAPPRMLEEFDIPDHLIVARIAAARVVAPSERKVRMPIDGGFVAMVDREVFDEWLRERARGAGAERIAGRFERIERDGEGLSVVYKPTVEGRRGAAEARVRARRVIGADGAVSAVARQEVPEAAYTPRVSAYHEIVRAPEGGFDGASCDVIYDARISPDFYGWVFPHGRTVSVGVGSAIKGYKAREATAKLRAMSGLADCETLRCEGAPLPLHPHRRWDNGRDVVLAGDAAGVVAPASGEGIYYAMLGGRLAAQAADESLGRSGARALGGARKRFMKAHGRVFMMLGLMQRFWYANDDRRERFVRICEDPDVQALTWSAYMSKRLTPAPPAVHARIFAKNIAHLTGLAAA
ncbi:MAG: geranylgeranyl diphosphate reductase, partial [Caulobacteraceae bacterium]|nr:geranylgeranyl diphosphate reductase [Caulobacter sp.]